MGTFPHSRQSASGTLSAASYLTAPPDLPAKWQVSAWDADDNAYLHLLSQLSKRTDISGILQSGCPLADALEQALQQWLEAIYPKSLLEFYQPMLEVRLHPDDPETDSERFLKIAFSNRYVNWGDFQIADEIEQAETLWPGTGIAILNALTNLPFRHYLWTPENIMNFVREFFWWEYRTEQEFMEAEHPDWLEQNDDDSLYPFTDERLKPLTLWENRKPAAEAASVAREILAVCDRINADAIDSCDFGTTFPTGIVWRDEDHVVSDVIEEFELEQQEMDHYRPHAGGTQWECRELQMLERTLKQIELYLKETEELANAIVHFKTRMQSWIRKKQSSSMWNAAAE